jgi:hypothetical protein
MDGEFNLEYWKVHRECVEIWDLLIWSEIYCGKDTMCSFYEYPLPPWYEIPGEKMKTMLSMGDLATWCEHRYFPIERYPLCGTALVYYSKTGKISAVLDREAKKWCEKHEDDAECAAM